MRVIESFIRGKYADQSLCEDGIVIGTGIVAVVDGVTSRGRLRWHGGTGGRFAKEVLCSYITEHEDELVQLTAAECMRTLNRVLAEEREAVHPGNIAIAEFPRACVILYNSKAREVWRYGDCLCMIGGEPHCEGKEVDRLLSELRSFITWSGSRERQEAEVGRRESGAGAQAHGGREEGPAVYAPGRRENGLPVQPAQGGSVDAGREAIQPLIERQLWFENTPGPFGYPVLNGRNFAEEMVRVWPVPDGAEVILATDGYPELCATLAESEEKLREIIEEDPLCIGVNAGTKGIMEKMESFDDRAFVRAV